MGRAGLCPAAWTLAGMGSGQWEGWLLDMGADMPGIPSPWLSKGARQTLLIRAAGTCGTAEGQGTRHSSTGALPILLSSGECSTPVPRPMPLGLLLKGTQMFAQLTAAAGSEHQPSHLKISGPFLTPLIASLPESVRTCFATECGRTRLAAAIPSDIPDIPVTCGAANTPRDGR